MDRRGFLRGLAVAGIANAVCLGEQAAAEQAAEDSAALHAQAEQRAAEDWRTAGGVPAWLARTRCPVEVRAERHMDRWFDGLLVNDESESRASISDAIVRANVAAMNDTVLGLAERMGASCGESIACDILAMAKDWDAEGGA